MNASVELCKNVLASLTGETAHNDRATHLFSFRHASEQLRFLVRWLFLSAVPERKRVLFLATGPETDVCSISERVGTVLADTASAHVALVNSFPSDAISTTPEEWPRPGNGFGLWEARGCQLQERLWRIPTEAYLESIAGQNGASSADLPFQFIVLAADLFDSAAPALCRSSQGIVLAITANSTRREAALHAKEVLAHWNIKLLGAVLDNRRFLIPEAVYRRL